MAARAAPGRKLAAVDHRRPDRGAALRIARTLCDQRGLCRAARPVDRRADSVAPRRRGGQGGAVTRHICLHGAESTGKSTLVPRLALRLGGLIVPEYGRTYAEANGTDLDETDQIGRAHVCTPVTNAHLVCRL